MDIYQRYWPCCRVFCCHWGRGSWKFDGYLKIWIFNIWIFENLIWYLIFFFGIWYFIWYFWWIFENLDIWYLDIWKFDGYLSTLLTLLPCILLPLGPRELKIWWIFENLDIWYLIFNIWIFWIFENVIWYLIFFLVFDIFFGISYLIWYFWWIFENLDIWKFGYFDIWILENLMDIYQRYWPCCRVFCCHWGRESWKFGGYLKIWIFDIRIFENLIWYLIFFLVFDIRFDIFDGYLKIWYLDIWKFDGYLSTLLTLLPCILLPLGSSELKIWWIFENLDIWYLDIWKFDLVFDIIIFFLFFDILFDIFDGYLKIWIFENLMDIYQRYWPCCRVFCCHWGRGSWKFGGYLKIWIFGYLKIWFGIWYFFFCFLIFDLIFLMDIWKFGYLDIWKFDGYLSTLLTLLPCILLPLGPRELKIWS